MSYYKVQKTTTGRKYKVRTPDNERTENLLWWILTYLGTGICAAGMFFLWIKIGG